MNKRLRFESYLVSKVLSGEKTSTWRLWDDKDLAVDDLLSLVDRGTDREFAFAKIDRILEKSFKELTGADKVGHEGFKSDEEMYATYTKFYDRKVDQDSVVKIIWFELVK